MFNQWPDMENGDFSFLIGGEAGAGIARAGFLFAKACMRGGLHVFGTNDYQSLIRGGHNFYVARVSDREVFSQMDFVHLIIALNSETVVLHRNKLVPNGGVIYDKDDLSQTREEPNSSVKFYPVPMRRIVIEELKEPHNLIIMNSVALGAATAVTDYDLNLLAELLKETFKPEIAETNIKAARIGYNYIKEHFEANFEHKLRKMAQTKSPRIFLNGNEAVGLGALKAGCKLYVSYPMTPTTGLLHFMASNERDFNMVTIQPEGEIAAINMAIGAAYAGVRAMTATSGGGFCLMSEGLGMSGMTETPIVVMVGQRPGPSTGLPTYTAQGDLRFVIHASQGEFPRIVIAPGDFEECFYETVRAFNWAEKYQLPVILLTDKYVLESEVSAERFDMDKVTIERGLVIRDSYTESRVYGRYEVTETGASPRAIPSTAGAIVRANSDEHDEFGLVTEDPAVTTTMCEKRMRKLYYVKREIEERNIETTKFYGSEEAEATIISWGSTKGPIKEALRLLSAEGKNVNFLQILYLHPFPKAKVEEAMNKARKTAVVENNNTSQLSSLIRDHVLRKVDHKILKYDGRPFSPIMLAERIKEVL
ncbi:2-oxoacid:acceptor oxidoreductase subunit alpha [Candidatus Bathyarchaeota archaeon]|nr:2-oxoacid:acceptor oxidoreductase subunit alpha [Candidatus Bathyarchaeota archaeon]